MSTVIPTMPQTAIAAPPTSGASPLSLHRADVMIENKIAIPGWIDTLEEYRRWAESDEYPQSGWVSYLNGVIWVDPNMEEFLTHNQIKQAFNGMFFSRLAEEATGRYVPDR